MRRTPFWIWLVLLAGWIAAEISVFNLVAAWTGGLMAFLLFILKSVAGFAFVGQLIRKKLAGLGTVSGVAMDATMLSGVSLKVFGAVLLVIPGFLAGVLGLALLTPSIRSVFARSVFGGGGRHKTQNPRDIDLPAGDWTEVQVERKPTESAKRLRRRKTPDSET
jgi:UPF0716 family protein affecting phage T7 exclusion